MERKSLTVYNRPETIDDRMHRRKQHFSFEEAQKQFYAEREQYNKELMEALDNLSRSL